jgi:hypothetical protein
MSRVKLAFWRHFAAHFGGHLVIYMDDLASSIESLIEAITEQTELHDPGNVFVAGRSVIDRTNI